ncbi:glycosidase crf1 [Fusarium albosuccineum]|uniref:Crh-like protein n=1 Tax=Fusarium albosuccineum TaxID=1237068 RepID=A0A8H4PDU3_9HYPO|nr:glycosidase crf1 [Fusarium albosuccineum]
MDLLIACPAEPALGKEKVSCSFAKGECDAFKEMPGTELKYDSKGAHFTIRKEGEAPTVASGKFIFFGRVDIEMQAAAGQGIVTSIVLQSNTLDEIDWEWVGGDAQQVQSNYFSKGDTTTYDRAAYHAVTDPLTTYHKYTIEWTKEAVKWIVDGNVLRTLKASEVKGFPESPMQIKLGTWCAGGKETPKGTVEWAGGYTDFSKAPFEAYYKSISIVDYAGGDSPSSKSVKEYVYGDNSGSWESIEIKYGESSDDEKDGEKSSTQEKATSQATSASVTEAHASSQTNTQGPIALVAPIGVSNPSNSTATPAKGSSPAETEASDGETVQSAANQSVVRGGIIAAALLLVSLVA